MMRVSVQYQAHQERCADKFPCRNEQAVGNGRRYTIATGTSVPNEAIRKIRACTSNIGTEKITMQVSGVHNLQAAMRKVCKAGHMITLFDDWSFMHHKATGESTHIHRKHGVHVLESWGRI